MSAPVYSVPGQTELKGEEGLFGMEKDRLI